MESKKYIDLIKMGENALDDLRAPFEEKKAKKDLEKEKIILEQQISELEFKIQKEKSKKPFSSRSIVDAIDEKQLAERELSIIDNLLKELF